MKPQEKNDKQAKPVKRVLTERDLRRMPGIAVTTALKCGYGECEELFWDCLDSGKGVDVCFPKYEACQMG